MPTLPEVSSPLTASYRRRGRGSVSNASGRFEPFTRIDEDDGWGSSEELPPFTTTVTEETARHILTRNSSPDLPFDRSINAYRGCEHGCVYCFARPTHSYMGLSAGLDFESKLFAKPNAAELLKRELAKPGYVVAPIALGTNTDPYQPIERDYRITRDVLKVLLDAQHPVAIITKSATILQDIDLLAALAAKGLVKVGLSLTTLDRTLARLMEPRAPTPEKRLDAINGLSRAGVPCMVMVAPVIPALNDHEIETLLMRAQAAGAQAAGYVLLRLPHDVKDLFKQWLELYYPHRAKRILSLLQDTRDGKLNDSQFGSRFVGQGPIAWLIGRRFEAACQRLGLHKPRLRLRTDLFVPPVVESRAALRHREKMGGQQLCLF